MGGAYGIVGKKVMAWCVFNAENSKEGTGKIQNESTEFPCTFFFFSNK